MSNKTDIVTTPERSRLMAKVRQSGTAAELAVQKIVESCGVDFQTEAHDLPGTPDLVNRERRWAIFVNGCFWHRHKNCPNATIPATNKKYWSEKFEKNVPTDDPSFWTQCMETLSKILNSSGGSMGTAIGFTWLFTKLVAFPSFDDIPAST